MDFLGGQGPVNLTQRHLGTSPATPEPHPIPVSPNLEPQSHFSGAMGPAKMTPGATPNPGQTELGAPEPLCRCHGSSQNDTRFNGTKSDSTALWRCHTPPLGPQKPKLPVNLLAFQAKAMT